MKKVFWIFSFCALSFSTVFGQDDNMYNDNNAQQPASNYNQGYDNSAAINNGDYNYNGGYNSNYNNQPGTQAFAENGDQDDQSYEGFYDQLSPYGSWVYYAGYGNVWVPQDVPSDFSPYVTSGHWVYADCGWTWSSDYDWGSIPFHYGRWFRDNTYGWMWMPGYEWAPAWVAWGSYDNYYCWAPLAPFVSYSATYYNTQSFCWNFVARDRFCEANLGGYLANRNFYGRGDYRVISAHINIINESHTYGHRSYFSGPRVNEVASVTGHRIDPVHVNSVSHAVAPHINVNSNQVHNQKGYNHNNVQAQQQVNRPITNINRFQNTQNNYRANVQPNNTVQSQQQFNRPAANVNRFENNQNVYHANVQAQQQYNRPNVNMSRPENNVQNQRPYNQNQNMVRANVQQQMPAQQHLSQPSAPSRASQNFSQQPRSFERSQPVQRQTERTFASAQRSAPAQVNHSSPGGLHSGRR